MSSYSDTVEIRSAKHLGALIRGHRLERNWSQALLAEKAGVSRQWIVAVESGKRTAEVGHVLSTVAALGCVLDLIPAVPPSNSIDLDELLDG